MKVKYYEINLEGESKSDIIFLKNGNLWFFLSPKKKSRYFGGFIFWHQQALRFLDDINFNDEIQEIIILSPSETIISFKNNQAYFNLESNSLKITFSSYQNIQLTFDIKAIFDNDPFKRKIKIEKISSISFLVEEFFEGYGFIKTLIESDSFLNFRDNWIDKFFDFDYQRNSPPFNWKVFDGIYGKVKEIKIKIVSPDIHRLDGSKMDYTDNINQHRSLLDDKASALDTYKSVNNFLLSRFNSLILDNYIPAGFPWFYENWNRDELLSMFLIHGLNRSNTDKTNKTHQHKSALNPYLSVDERIKSYLYNLENIWDKNIWRETNQILSADTFLLFILNLPQDLFIAHFSLLEKYLQKWQKKFNLDNLPPYSTWMDTLERKSALEIDVLYLKVLRRMAKINRNYVSVANSLKEKIIKKIKENLADINLIFAFLFLEDIFSLQEWKIFFEKLLKENYLGWGGLATLSLNNKKFLYEDDGEKSQAYHQGDSWYFLNNLLVYSLIKIDNKKFNNFIEKIIESSLIDLFFDGALGWSSEISSAKERKSEGSLVQTWSIASLIFLMSFLQNINIFLKSFGNSHNVIAIKA